MKKNKSLKIVTTAALVASLATPFAAGTASAANYNGTNVVGVTAGKTDAAGAKAGQALGKVYVEFSGSELSTGDYLLVTLPSDFELNYDGSTPTSGTVANNGTILGGNVKLSIAAGDNFLNNNIFSGISYDLISKNQVKLTFNRDKSAGTANGVELSQSIGKFYIEFPDVYVPSSVNGEVKATLEGKQGSAFTSGSVTVATASSSGSVTTTIDKAKTVTTSLKAIDNIRIKEDRAGSFSAADVLKYKLPAGFKWQYKSGNSYVDFGTDYSSATGVVSELSTRGIAASDIQFKVADEGRKLYVKNNGGDSAEASYLLLQNLGIAISDETLAKTGEVTAAISTDGDVTSQNGDLLVAKYGDYGVKLSVVGDVPTVQAGLTEEKLGKFAIEESVKGSLQKDRTITLTLNGNAKWTKDSILQSDFKYDDAQTNHKDLAVLNPANAAVIGSDRKTLRITVGKESTDSLKAVLKDAKIDVNPEAEGDIKVAFGGSANLSGELTLATVKKPVVAKVDGALPVVQIGQQSQPIGDIVVTENSAGAIDHDTASSYDELSLIFPAGVTPTLPTSVQVTDGDLSLDTSSVTKQYADNKWRLSVKTRSTSGKASTVKFSGVKVVVDRTVPEGPISVNVGGDALVETKDIFPGADHVTSFDIATVGTPAAGKGSVAYVAFKLGATTYTVDGVEKTMDVAPFAANNRTFLPIRFAADALGATNVQWDQATKTVTVFKNGNIVQMVLGKKEYKLNGISVPMDVAVQAKNGRVVLPIRFLGDALNVPVNYNETTGEIALGTPVVK